MIQCLVVKHWMECRSFSSILFCGKSYIVDCCGVNSKPVYHISFHFGRKKMKSAKNVELLVDKVIIFRLSTG